LLEERAVTIVTVAAVTVAATGAHIVLAVTAMEKLV
jgi:hypothetical protein